METVENDTSCRGSARRDFVSRLEKMAEAQPENRVIASLLTLSKANIGVPILSRILMVDEKTLRRWASGTLPRKGDQVRVVDLAARATRATSAGMLPMERPTYEEIVDRLRAASKQAPTNAT